MGITNAEKMLKEVEKKVFVPLESELLDILHCQRLYNDVQNFEVRKNEIIEQLEILAQSSTGKSFVTWCVPPQTTSPAIISSSTPQAFFDMTEHTQAQIQQYAPKIEIELLTEFIPIAYCYQLTYIQFPLINFRIFNSFNHNAEAIINISAKFEGYSDLASRDIVIQAGNEYYEALLPVLQKERIKLVNEQCPVTLHTKIEYISPAFGTRYNTQRVYFLPYDVAILWQIQRDGSLLDCTPYLAAWVTPHHPDIDKLLNEAVKYLPERRITGYIEAATREEQAQKVREQARAIFEVLHHEVKLTYVSSPGVVGKQIDRVTQRVRLPSEVLKSGGSANCIDGSVLFASLLELANIQALIFLLEGHAFVGWRVFKDEPVYEFLETTIIDKGDFERATRNAQRQYEQAKENGSLGREVGDLRSFARLIDIAACRSKNILPLE